MSDKLIKCLKNLIEEAEKDEGSILQVADLYIPYNHLYSDAAKKAVPFKKKSLKPARNQLLSSKLLPDGTEEGEYIRVFDEIMFFSVISRGEGSLYQAAKKVMKDVNELADKGFVSGYLSNLSYLRLKMDGLTLPHAVFCFPAVTPEGVQWLNEQKKLGKDLDTRTEEGQVGKEVS